MMRRLNQLSPISVYGVTAVIVALLCRWGNLSVTIVAGLAVVIWLLVELLSRNLPRSIRSAQTANCRRRNGTWSIARERAEAIAVGKLKGEMLLAVILVVMPTIAVVWFIDSEVIPISMGIDAMSVFEMSQSAWRENLASIQREFSALLQKKGLSDAAIFSKQKILWECWPFMMLAGLVWTALGFSFIKTAYFRALKDLSDSIQFRRLQHHMRDLNRTIEEHRESYSDVD